MLMFGVGIAACLVVFPLVGLSYGSSSGPALPIGVSVLLYARAGIAEEVFYRGYAIERMEALTGNRAIAAVVPLLIFAGSHFSQGLAGILITFVIGAIATSIYLWKRNLLIPDHRPFHGRFHPQRAVAVDLRGLTAARAVTASEKVMRQCPLPTLSGPWHIFCLVIGCASELLRMRRPIVAT